MGGPLLECLLWYSACTIWMMDNKILSHLLSSLWLNCKINPSIHSVIVIAFMFAKSSGSQPFLTRGILFGSPKCKIRSKLLK